MGVGKMKSEFDKVDSYNANDFSNNIVDATANLIRLANQITEIMQPIAERAKSIAEVVSENLKVISESIKPFAAIGKFAEAQFVWDRLIPHELIEDYEDNNTDKLIEKYCVTDKWLEELIEQCDLSDSKTFNQAIKAFYDADYNIAIIGFVAMFDRILTECSGIDITGIKKRAEVLTSKIEEGDYEKLDEIEVEDFVLYYTYSKAVVLFDDYADFKVEEPNCLNRHWIMHGRSNKEYTRLDCIKVLSMINGTRSIAILSEKF